MLISQGVICNLGQPQGPVVQLSKKKKKKKKALLLAKSLI